MNQFGCIRGLLTACAGLLLLSGHALAQGDPEAGDVGLGGDVGGDATGEATWSPPGDSGGSASGSASADVGDDDDDMGSSSMASGDTDHSQVIDRYGVGFFGVMNLPTCTDVAGCVAGGSVPDALPAPTIGARMWLDESSGVEAALGFHVSSGSRDNNAGMMTQTVEDPSLFGVGLHGGYVMVLADTKHMALELVPQLNLGFTTGSAPNGAMAPDTEFSGLLFEIGATIGGEVHFGFIDLPNLALQANVGALMRYESASVDTNGTGADVSRFTLRTNEGDTPWEIFAGTVSAIYYL